MQLHSLLAQGVTVITASRRLAHALRLSHAAHARSQGQLVWRTPQLLPWRTWLAQQWLEQRALTGVTHHTRLLSRTQEGLLWQTIVHDSPWAAGLLSPASAARQAQRSWHRMQDYLIEVPQLQQSDSTEAQALSEWAQTFVERCEALGVIDEARLAHWAHESDFQPLQPLAFTGFDTFPPAAKRLIDRWRDNGLVLDVEEGAEQGQVSVVGVRDAQSELQAAAHWSRQQVERGARNVAVVVPDLQHRRADVRRIFEDVFAPGQRHTLAEHRALPVVIAAPESLLNYPLVDAAMLVLDLALRPVNAVQAGRVLRSPFIAAAEGEADARALADCKLRESKRERWDWAELERLAAGRQCPELALAARRITEAVRGNTGKTSASRWAERFHAWLQAAGWPGERALDSIEHQTCAKFQEALTQFGALDVVLAPMSAGAALVRLREVLSQTLFEPQSGVGPVTVIDPQTLAGLQFDALWVVGLESGVLPEPVNPDPLLPVYLQREAGIPEASADTVMAMAKARLKRWVCSAPQVMLSWPQLQGEAALQPSALLARWPTQTIDDVLAAPVRQLRETLFEQAPGMESFSDPCAPPLSGSVTAGGAMTLELQSRCPFRAQAQLRLGAQPLPQLSIGVQPIDRGIILHRVLADIWGALGDQRALLAMDDDTLHERVEETTRRIALNALQPNTRHRERLVALEVQSVTRLVMQLLSLERLRPPFSIGVAEASKTYRIGGLEITLQPDRIDVLAEGQRLLIDYKLGDAHQPRQWLDTWPGRPRRPQLPLYALAQARQLQALAFVVLSPAEVAYRGWSSGGDVAPGVDPYPSGIKLRDEDPQNWADLLEHWQRTLLALSDGFVRGEAAVDPLPQECTYCHLHTLCRVHEMRMEVEEGVDD